MSDASTASAQGVAALAESFLDDVLAASTRTGPECGVHLLILRLRIENPDLADQLEIALRHPAAKATHIADRLRRAGYDLSDYTISRHRRGKCRCEA